MLVKALEVARKWARKSFGKYQDAPIWVQPVEADGKPWVFITTFRLKLGVPGTLGQGFRLDARDLTSPLKGELVEEGDQVFLVHKGARKRLPTVSLEEAKGEAEPDGVLHRYLNHPSLPRPDRLDFTLDAEDLAAVLVMRSDDPARPILTGIGLDPSGVMAASDGYQMALSRTEPFKDKWGWLRLQQGKDERLDRRLGIIFPDAATRTFFKKVRGEVRLTVYREDDYFNGEMRGFIEVAKGAKLPFLMWVEVEDTYPDFLSIAAGATREVLARNVVLPTTLPNPKDYPMLHLIGDADNQTLWLLALDERAAVAFSASIEAEVETWFWLAVNPAFLKNAQQILPDQPLTMTTSQLSQPGYCLASPFRFQGRREVVLMPIHVEMKWEALVQAAQASGIALPNPEQIPAPEPVPVPVPA